MKIKKGICESAAGRIYVFYKRQDMHQQLQQ